MTLLETPGIYVQPVQPVRAAGPLARGDVPVFLGYAKRGPAGVAVRVESLRQFADLFGEPYSPGHLSGVLKAFFETGGIACYVIRVTGPDAEAAEVPVVAAGEDPAAVAHWVARASFPWPRINPRALRTGDDPGAQAWAAAFDAQVHDHGRRTPDVGVWGDRLSVAITRCSLVSAETEAGRFEDGLASQMFNLAGLEAHSILELHQERSGAPVRAVGGDPLSVEVDRIDAARQLIFWKVPPERLATEGDPIDQNLPIRVASVEFRVDVYLDGRLVERFDHLSPQPEHSRSLKAVIATECRNLDLAPAFDVKTRTDWTDRANWPAAVTVSLTGGRDDVANVTAEVYLGKPEQSGLLEAQNRIDDIALIAAPDLVLEETAPEAQTPPVPPPEADCNVLKAPPEGVVTGKVIAGGLGTTDEPVPNVHVEAAGFGAVAATAADGTFTLTGLPLQLVTLRFSKAGFVPLETLTQAFEFAIADPEQFTLAAIAEPRRLTDTEILMVQQAMMNPAIVGPYRVAIIDPPSPTMTVDDFRTWRSKLGDSQRGAFFVPWVRAPRLDGLGSAAMPPSGHVTGALAAGERTTGIHRAPANLLLRHIDGVALKIDDAEQGLMNPAGINAIRAFPGRGVRIWGTRTISSSPTWRYATTRRLIDAIEKTLERALQWAVFEPNNVTTRQAVSFTISTLLERLWRQGALAGGKPAEAFAVKSDFDNNTQADRDNGRLIAEVAVAPSIPFEFILFRLGRALDAIEVTE